MKEVMLSPADEKAFRALTVDRDNALSEAARLKAIAREAVKAHNLAERKYRAIRAEWLELAERKFPQ